jgi:hypothetical protein
MKTCDNSWAVKTENGLRSKEASLIVVHPGDQLVGRISSKVSSIVILKKIQQKLV